METFLGWPRLSGIKLSENIREPTLILIELHSYTSNIQVCLFNESNTCRCSFKQHLLDWTSWTEWPLKPAVHPQSTIAEPWLNNYLITLPHCAYTSTVYKWLIVQYQTCCVDADDTINQVYHEHGWNFSRTTKVFSDKYIRGPDRALGWGIRENTTCTYNFSNHCSTHFLGQLYPWNTQNTPRNTHFPRSIHRTHPNYMYFHQTTCTFSDLEKFHKL